MLFSVHHIGRQRMSDHPITDGVNLDHLHTLVSARFRHQVSISFFVINEYFVENTETMPVSTLHQASTPHRQLLSLSIIIVMFAKWWLSYFLPFYIFWWAFSCKNLFSPIPIHLLINIDSLNLSSCFIIHYYIIYFNAPIFPDLICESPLRLCFWKAGSVNTILCTQRYVQCKKKTLIFQFALGVVRQHRNHSQMLAFFFFFSSIS